MILDNLSSLCREGSENEGEDWLPVQQWALDLRRRGKSVQFVHHAGKNKSQRGTSRREDLLDTVITLKHPSDYQPSEGLRCEVHFEKTRAMLGESAKAFEVQLTIDAQDEAIWTVSEIEDARFRQAAQLFASGLTVRDVADALGVSKSTAGRYRQKWDADGVNRASSLRPSVPLHRGWDSGTRNLAFKCGMECLSHYFMPTRDRPWDRLDARLIGGAYRTAEH